MNAPRAIPVLAALALRGLALAGLALAAPGCSAPAPGTPLPGGRPRSAVPEPFAAAAVNGAEVWRWRVDDLPSAIAPVLAGLPAEPPDADPAALEAWRRSGLRAVVLPAGRLGELRSAFPARGAIEETWIGQAPEWRELAAGPWFGRTVLGVAGSPARLDPGRVRLLLRAWTAPGPAEPGGAGTSAGGPAAVLRVELAAQHELSMRRGTFAELNARLEGGRPPPGARGPVLGPLVLGTRLAADEALVLIPEHPDVDWAALLDPEAAPPPAPVPADAPAGPRPPPPEPALLPVLTTPPRRLIVGPAVSAPASAPGTRELIVILPRLPQTYRLLPD